MAIVSSNSRFLASVASIIMEAIGGRPDDMRYLFPSCDRWNSTGRFRGLLSTPYRSALQQAL